MDFGATRNTCFALISSIEEDFRSLILACAEADASVLPDDVKENAMRRRTADLRMDSISSSVQDSELLPYIDFADISKILQSRIAPREAANSEWLVLISKEMLSLTAARNRVCHSRPLETDDLPKILDFSRNAVTARSGYAFSSTSATLGRLADDPGFVLTIQIPSFWIERPRIHHNLPIPEFDETGFVGRHSDRLNTLKLLKSHYPVLTVVGEGGVGKTALALRCLYDLLDDPSAPYDAIIWVSLKTAALTEAGVKNLSGAITSTLGLLSEVAKQLGGRKDYSRYTRGIY